MDKRKQKRLEDQQKKDRAQKEKNPSFQYVNYSELEFPRILRAHTMNDYAMIDDKLEKLWIECRILEEQMDLRVKLSEDIKVGKTDMFTSDGNRLMSHSELRTQIRIADLTAWTSKGNIERILIEMISMVGIETGDGFLLTETEHNTIAQTVINRVKRAGIDIFGSNKAQLIAKLEQTE